MTERPASPRLWAARAGVAERAVFARHLRHLWGQPGAALCLVAWPATAGQRAFGPWHYLWQAHVLDCLVDAQQRFPTTWRRTAVRRMVNGIHRRNLGTWLNDYYDDVAWLGLALARAQQQLGVRAPGAVNQIAARLREGWTDHGGGGIWWRRVERYHDDFKNVPANGPAAILLARMEDLPGTVRGDRTDRQRARSTVDWIEEYLIDEATGLVYDGMHVRRGPGGDVRTLETAIYTYCQGVFIGACVELATRDSMAGGTTWARRAARTIDAVARHVTVPDEFGPVLRGQGGGDGGLFAGILARYLALAALALPTLGVEYTGAARLAADLVYSSAEAAWRNRTIAPGGPLFGPEWTKPAVLPGRSDRPERDLSVQAGAWMLLEATARLEENGVAQV
ncbi:MAG TPA: glycoside hydrolase family 76 protein [Pseudonocardiaceae bacterium]|nr:glycoside hydrolase family 76 protein [Pseudonocardiaceae bacterium]